MVDWRNIYGEMKWTMEHKTITSSYILDFFVNDLPRGVAQVIFISNPISGYIIIIALLLNNWVAALYGLLAQTSATITAKFLELEDNDIRNGLHGFNGILVGLGFGTFLNPQFLQDNSRGTAITISLVILMGSLSTFLHVALKGMTIHIWKTPPFTIAFNMCMYFILGTAAYGQYAHFPSTIFSDISKKEKPYFTSLDMDVSRIFLSILTGIGQVYIIDKMIPSILVMIAVLPGSILVLMLSLTGSIIGLLIALYLGAPMELIQAGLYGYNPVLSVVAIGSVFYTFCRRTYIISCFAGIVATFMFSFFANTNKVFKLPVGSLPFCLTTMFFVVIKDHIFLKQKHKHKHHKIKASKDSEINTQTSESRGLNVLTQNKQIQE